MRGGVVRGADGIVVLIELTFWNCASLFVWNTWEFCQQSIAWHQSNNMDI